MLETPYSLIAALGGVCGVTFLFLGLIIVHLLGRLDKVEARLSSMSAKVTRHEREMAESEWWTPVKVELNPNPFIDHAKDREQIQKNVIGR